MTKKNYLNSNLCLSSIFNQGNLSERINKKENNKRNNKSINKYNSINKNTIAKNFSIKKENKDLKQLSFSSLKTKILSSQYNLSSYRNSYNKKKIMLYPNINYTKNIILNNNNVENNSNSQTDNSHTSNNKNSNSKISFDNNSYYQSENNKNDCSEPIKRSKKIIIFHKNNSEKNTTNTTNKNYLFNDLINIKSPEDYHFLNVKILQKKKKLIYKFENIKEINNNEIIQIGENI